jgi:hypothetical protein
MGYKLWISDLTGEKRNGTGFVDFKKMFTESITAKNIYENLRCCKVDDVASYVKEELLKLDFDSTGVINEDGDIIGYVLSKELGDGNVSDFLHEFKHKDYISDSTPLSEIINSFKDRDSIYINYIDKIIGIVTKADLNKPPVRVYIFGVISLFEIHLSSWIGRIFTDGAWRKIISPGRLNKASSFFEMRQSEGMNQELTLIECLQLCDKKKILASSQEFLSLIDKNNVEFNELMCNVEEIRNNVAHSQYSIIHSISFDVMTDVIKECERFLLRSDEIALRIAREGLNN